MQSQKGGVQGEVLLATPHHGSSLVPEIRNPGLEPHLPEDSAGSSG